MAQIDLTITIPDNPELQASMIEAVRWMNRDIEGNPSDMTPVQAKTWVEAEMRKWLRRKVRSALEDKARAQTENWDI